MFEQMDFLQREWEPLSSMRAYGMEVCIMRLENFCVYDKISPEDSDEY